MRMYHKPVLLDACLEGLALKESGTYVDVTFGGGGHTKAILDAIGSGGKVIAFDQDEDAAENSSLVKKIFQTQLEQVQIRLNLQENWVSILMNYKVQVVAVELKKRISKILLKTKIPPLLLLLKKKMMNLICHISILNLVRLMCKKYQELKDYLVHI